MSVPFVNAKPSVMPPVRVVQVTVVPPKRPRVSKDVQQNVGVKRVRDYESGYKTGWEEGNRQADAVRKEGYRAGYREGWRARDTKAPHVEKANIRKIVLQMMKEVHPDHHDTLCPNLVSQKLLSIVHMLN